MDMSGRRPPKIGHPVLDTLIGVAWAVLATFNFWFSASAFADVMVGLGALATALLSALRIYEHLVGETLSDTLWQQEA